MTTEFPFIPLSAVKEDGFYILDDQLMTGSGLLAYVQASEPANPDELLIEPVVELSKEILTGEQSEG